MINLDYFCNNLKNEKWSWIWCWLVGWRRWRRVRDKRCAHDQDILRGFHHVADQNSRNGQRRQFRRQWRGCPLQHRKTQVTSQSINQFKSCRYQTEIIQVWSNSFTSSYLTYCFVCFYFKFSRNQDRERTGFFLSLAYSANLGGTGTIVGSGTNLIVKGLVKQ